MKTPEKKWYQKKGSVIALVVLGLIIAAGASNGGSTAQVAGTSLNREGTSQVSPSSAYAPRAPATPPPQSAIFHTHLSYGSSGTAVANMQQFLNDEGLG